MTQPNRRISHRLGLTGGIGSGKSTVAAILHGLGAHIVDADAISRKVTQADGAAMPEIARVFGSEYIASDGSLNRVRMRELVFAHPSTRLQLEAIVHPLVVKELDWQAKTSTASSLIFDVPLLVEGSRWRRQLDAVWIVDCTLETQITRVQHRNGWSRSAVEAVIANQSDRRDRLVAADAVLYNESISLMKLQALVEDLAIKFKI